jgi:hypothetical protein
MGASELTDTQLVRLLEHPPDANYALANAQAIVDALNTVGVRADVHFDLAAVAASVFDESRGYNTWGHDPWDQDNYPKGICHEPGPPLDPVTEDNWLAAFRLVEEGYQAQGFGPAQLTATVYWAYAKKLGEPWLPERSLEIGFRSLQQYFVAFRTPQLAYERYNGGGEAAIQYGIRVNGYRLQWQAWINAL